MQVAQTCGSHLLSQSWIRRVLCICPPGKQGTTERILAELVGMLPVNPKRQFPNHPGVAARNCNPRWLVAGRWPSIAQPSLE